MRKLSALVLGLSLVGSAAAEVIKLNDPLVAPQAVVAYTLSPDGNTVVYVVGDNDTDQATMYSVPALRTSPPVQLNGTVASGAIGPITLNEYYAPKITSDNQRVLYTSDEQSADSIQLYTVPIGGGTPALLSGVLGTTGVVVNFTLVPGATSALFIGGINSTNDFDLYRVAVDGSSAAVNLTTSTNRAPAHLYRLTPDSTKVIFQGIDPVTTSIVDVYTVPLAGGTLQQLSTLGRAFLVYPLVSNDRAFFIADNEITQQFNLYTVPTNGSSAPVKVNPTLTTIGSDAFMSRHIAQSSRVTFRITDFNLSNPPKMYGASENGTGAALIHPANFSPDSVYGYTNDETRVLVSGRYDTDPIYPYLLNANGSGSPVRLNPTEITFGGGLFYPAKHSEHFYFYAGITGKGSQYVRYDIATDAVETPLFDKGVTFTTFPTPVFSADEKFFVFGVSGFGPTRLYTYSNETDEIWRITDDFVTNGGIDVNTLNPVSIAANGTAVIYRAEQDIDMVAELYVNTNAVAPPTAVGKQWMNYE